MVRASALLFPLFLCVALIFGDADAHAMMTCIKKLSTGCTTDGEGRNIGTCCKGYPRNYQNAGQRGNGGPWGLPKQGGPIANGDRCGGNQDFSTSTSNSYTPAYPEAKIAPGEDFTVAWAPFNHAVRNQNPRVVKLYMSPELSTLTDDPSQATFNSKSLGEQPFIGSDPGCAGGTGSATCTGKFTMPAGTPRKFVSSFAQNNDALLTFAFFYFISPFSRPLHASMVLGLDCE